MEKRHDVEEEEKMILGSADYITSHYSSLMTKCEHDDKER